MSKTGLQQVIQKAVSDAAFRRQLQREPAKALAGFDLTADERSSVTGGDPARLTALGVDQRMSKAFALGAAAEASTPVSYGTTGDMGTAGSAAFVDEAATGTSRGLMGDSTSGASSVFASDATSGATSISNGIAGDVTSGAASGIASDATSGATSITNGLVGDATSGATGAMVGSDGPQLDAGFVGDSTSGAAGIIPDPGTAGVSAFEDVDASGDMNVIDPGLAGGSGNAAFADDASALTSQLDGSSGLDTGGDVHPTEY